jgi:hypothetical protein
MALKCLKKWYQNHIERIIKNRNDWWCRIIEPLGRYSSEGKAIILTAANKTMVNEDMENMKRLMGYKSQDTLWLSKGKTRLDENAF